MDILQTIYIASLLVLLYVFCDFLKSRNEPPGPIPLPFVGNLIYIGQQDPVNYLALHKVSQKYGEIVSLKIGSKKNILVSSYEAARDLYSRCDCLDRPVNGIVRDRNLKQNIGLAFSNDTCWTTIRKFCSKTLREYGFGSKTAMEKLVQAELQLFVANLEDEIDESKNGILYFNRYFQPSLLNLMRSMISSRVSYDDKDLKDLIRASNDWFDVPVMGFLTVMAFPWMRFLCPGILGYTQQMNALRDMHSYSLKVLEDRRNKKHFLEKPECFADSYLKMAHQNANNRNSIFTDDQFQVLCTDLMQGGSDTTANWLSFAFLYLITNPRVQQKVFDEIVTVIGLNRMPASRDRDIMTYTQAVICEIHRCSRVVIVLPPRETTEDFLFNNYSIKKDTTILVNLHSCFMDPKVWKEPEVFRPERFLDSDGELVDTERVSIAFGAGRRVCFGEPMAKDSSFLYLTTLLQKFEFSVPPNYPPPDIEPVPGILLSPKPYHVLVQRR